MGLTRRQFLKAGIAGGALLAAVRVAYGPPGTEPERQAGDYAYLFLTGRDRALFATLIPVILDGSVDAADTGTIERVLQALDRSLQAPAPAIQKELRDLFNLLEFPVTRRLLAGVWAPWHEAGSDEIHAFLARWRASRFGLLNSAYIGLTALVKGAWFGLPESFARIGYPGPPEIAVRELLGGKAW